MSDVQGIDQDGRDVSAGDSRNLGTLSRLGDYMDRKEKVQFKQLRYLFSD